MKKMGIAAIITAVVFLAFAIIGGICLGIGIADIAANSDLDEVLHTYADDFITFVENAKDYASYNGSESYEIFSSVDTIVIEDFTGNITIRPTEIKTAYPTVIVEYDGLPDLSGEKSHIQFTENSGKLTISPKNSTSNTNFGGIINTGSNAGDVVIYLPQYDSLSVPLDFNLTISNTVGEITVCDYNFEDVSLVRTVGEISFENINANFISFENTVGEINAEGGFGGISVVNNIGECTIENNTVLLHDSKIENNVAEVNITLPETSSVNFTSSSSFGDIDIDDELIDKNSSVSFEIIESAGSISIEAN